MKILFVGDIIGRPGRQLVQRCLPRLVDRHRIDLVVANGENAAAGFGLTRDVVSELLDLGIDVLTSGNHVWDKKDGLVCIEQEPALLRPANYPPGAAGRGYGLFRTAGGEAVAVINLEGRVFMRALDCPFRKADEILKELAGRCTTILVDFHAEATSEKWALGAYLDGRVSAVLGTHTHVPTADERILPGGTAFITDAGMTGARDSVIGIRKELSISRFLTQLPVKYEVAKNDPLLCAVVVTVDAATGHATEIVRVQAGESVGDF
ncbi:MAG: TIGR00282 family metallophosphoesterase [Desulfuromonadales bacterium]|nr:TIGR00282 family metallophosphoesterase [Desulfuromonadales bacterium]